MVYCGKPSKGCENCRAKRLKCDQKRPSCSQCSNKRRECRGYRDTIDLAFRNESQKVVTKYCKGFAASESSEDRHKLQNLGYPWLQYADTLKPTQIRPSINEPMEDVAVTFLLKDYIQGSHFEYLPALYTVGDVEGVLSTALKAVGLASLSLYASRPELRTQALMFYSKAITKVNNSLKSQNATQRDDVLASIMLLSLYEALTLRKTSDTKAWSSHIHGAWSLVALRGPQQFQTKVGLELFKHIATGVRLFCIQNCIRIPIQLRELVESAALYSQTPDPIFSQPSATEAFTDLRTDIAEGLLSEPDDIIARCEVVLRLVEDFFVINLSCQQYDRVAVGPPEIASAQKFCINFRNHQVAYAWNAAWMAKLALNSMIYKQELQVLKKAMSPEEMVSNASRTIRAVKAQEEIAKAAENVCATVPQSFQLNVPPKRSEKPLAAVFMGYSLIWPLFTVGANPLVTASTKDYIINTLIYIAREFKLPQAHWAEELLREGASDEAWMHMYHAF
ncbi:uncharacterized protein A1O9_06132 [Exophiala aquamarina CBS 119918]|uniref:Zn(2)-C6 fungal-type domain-containing protein n=1 Tax=Exophiala aquamarina CBS 119918 TaxID=1182545 RepID=A0A072PED5_9EURO|nr:uncharacterized protein A1O9_06132 [Exophiala aquamarina CBS 119918]KEF58206.1 hypothetical protein A1O9_06132 [Exophiala aquamarina CBS 119918]